MKRLALVRLRRLGDLRRLSPRGRRRNPDEPEDPKSGYTTSPIAQWTASGGLKQEPPDNVPPPVWKKQLEEATSLSRRLLGELRTELVQGGFDEADLPSSADTNGAYAKAVGYLIAAAAHPSLKHSVQAKMPPDDLAVLLLTTMFPKAATDRVKVTAQKLAHVFAAKRAEMATKVEGGRKLVERSKIEPVPASTPAQEVASLRTAGDYDEDEFQEFVDEFKEMSPEELADEGKQYDLTREDGETKLTFLRRVARAAASEVKAGTAMLAGDNEEEEPEAALPPPKAPTKKRGPPKTRKAEIERLQTRPSVSEVLGLQSEEEQAQTSIGTRSASARARLGGFAAHRATTRRRDIGPTPEQLLATKGDILIFLFVAPETKRRGTPLEDASAQVWIKGALTDSFLPTQGRSGFKTALLYARQWLAMGSGPHADGPPKKSRANCRVLLAAAGDPELTVIHAPTPVAAAAKVTVAEAMAALAADESKTLRKNPRTAPYTDVLRLYGPAGFGVPQNAPNVGSFPLHPIGRARYALAIIASPTYDRSPATRRSVMAAVERTYGNTLQSEIQSARRTVTRRLHEKTFVELRR